MVAKPSDCCVTDGMTLNGLPVCEKPRPFSRSLSGCFGMCAVAICRMVGLS